MTPAQCLGPVIAGGGATGLGPAEPKLGPILLVSVVGWLFKKYFVCVYILREEPGCVGELVLCVPGRFGCPCLAGGEKPGQMEGGGGKGSCTSTPSPGNGRLTPALCPDVDTEDSLTCLLKVAEPGFELGAPVPDPRGQKQPLARLPHPCPLIASRLFSLHPHPHSSSGQHS